ncbi:hypothetical protein CSUNSWCD_2259 [Campylobacter showae CSUNSWCD]|uniref:Uncharacterized protein n=1 Tax=Campylobacter showae CSUNSWCD TaxID=1244083 RepID=M5IQC9_9BACT|nr:hypothetical protein CSUNSWCD_2259 [Campylobacter showae CSUNSWCD]
MYFAANLPFSAAVWRIFRILTSCFDASFSFGFCRSGFYATRFIKFTKT